MNLKSIPCVTKSGGLASCIHGGNAQVRRRNPCNTLVLAPTHNFQQKSNSGSMTYREHFLQVFPQFKCYCDISWPGVGRLSDCRVPGTTTALPFVCPPNLLMMTESLINTQIAFRTASFLTSLQSPAQVRCSHHNSSRVDCCRACNAARQCACPGCWHVSYWDLLFCCSACSAHIQGNTGICSSNLLHAALVSVLSLQQQALPNAQSPPAQRAVFLLMARAVRSLLRLWLAHTQKPTRCMTVRTCMHNTTVLYF